MTFAYTLVNSLVPSSPVTQTVVTDRLGNVTTYRFNTNGFVVGVTDASGQVRTITRQSGTNLVLTMQGTGACTECGDSKVGNVTFTYDPNGNLLTQTDALGNTTTYTYDSVYNHVTSEADALGNQRAQAVKGVSSTISSGAGVLGAPPSHQNGEQRRTPITRRWVRVFGRADGRGQFREEGLHLPSKMHSGKGRDPWLSELLARASREVDEDDQELRRLPR